MNNINIAPKNFNTVVFGIFFYFYFYTWSSCFLFLPVWLKNAVGLDKTHIGLIFSSFSLAAICLQPVFGMITDRLGVKKTLIWVIVCLMIFFAPFFLYVYTPLLKSHIYLGIILGAIYLSCIFHAGVGAIEAFVEKVSRNTGFEYGRARLFGCFGSATCATVAGILYSLDPQWVFWFGSLFAIFLSFVLAAAKTGTPVAITQDKPGSSPLSVIDLLKMKKFWMLTVYVLGVACVYDVFDQQFINFFSSFFPSQGEAVKMFGYITTAGNLGDAVIMFFIPAVINKIGSKTALLIAGGVMAIRILGSSFATTAEIVMVLKMLHNIEVPFLLVGIFKYISDTFDVRLSATVYLIGFQFIKQLASIILSTIAGKMYDNYGFHDAYVFLGSVVLIFTIISFFTLSGRASHKQRYQEQYS